jgi:O-antigen/teichoic acid export membrane protein
MANELKIGHTKVTTLYMAIQLAVSLAFIYAIPDTTSAHWIYMSATIILLSLAYLLFMKKYYHLHEDYLKTINDKQ